ARSAFGLWLGGFEQRSFAGPVPTGRTSTRSPSGAEASRYPGSDAAGASFSDPRGDGDGAGAALAVAGGSGSTRASGRVVGLHAASSAARAIAAARGASRDSDLAFR